MLGFFLIPDHVRERRLAEEKENIRERLTRCTPWSPDLKWDFELQIQAKTYPVRKLFEVEPVPPRVEPRAMVPEHYVESPRQTWRYTHRTLPRGTKLSTWYGSKIGSVIFDQKIEIPVLYRSREYQDERYWEDAPWMSLTPAEILSLRSGTRLGKGRVVVAGLGLGHQLIEVSQRKQVKELTLVEQSEELCEWLFPKIKPYLGCEVKIIVGDAYKEMPKLEADVGLVDIFHTYGNNLDEVNDLRSSCTKIKRIWGWGTAPIHTSLWDV